MDESRPLNDDFSSRIRRKPVSIESVELRNTSHDRPSSPHIPHLGHSSAHTLIDKQDRQPQRSCWIDRLWVYEVFSIAVAALALAALIITLLLHKDRPLPKWPSAITINTLIAIFTAILKACLMMPIAEAISQLKWLWFQKSRPLKHMEQFDFASRGPWGSFLLMFTLKGRDLAVVGAVLTIVAMAVDPFAQQIIQYYSCAVIVPFEVANVPFSNNYTNGIYGRPTGTPEVDAQMQSAIYVGLLDPPSNSSATLTYACRTGNCTFPSTEDGATFLSLALESSCIDISKEIRYSFNVTNGTNTADNSTYTSTIANTSLPNGVFYTNYSGSTVMQTGNEYSTDVPSKFLTKVSLLMASYSSEKKHSARAFECELFPVVNTYSANITNSVLLEQVLHRQRMEVWPVPFNTFSMLLVNRTIRAGRWEECKGMPDPSDENNFPIVTGENPTIPSIGTSMSFDQLTNKSLDTWNHTQWWPQDCVYYLPYAPTEGLAASIFQFLGNESLEMDSWTSRADGDLWAVNLWNNGSATLDSVQKFMKGLTDSVTTRWRQGDGISDNMGPANGSVHENATCVHVRWGWLALPAALFVLTVVFLILTIIQTSLQGSGLVWKSSILALLFNGLDAKTRQSYGPVLSLKEVEKAAEAATVQLEETEDGWRLVGT